MAARVQTTFAEDHDMGRYPVWDEAADDVRHYDPHKLTDLQYLIVEIIQEEGMITQYALWRTLEDEWGIDDPKQARLSEQLLILRREGIVKSETDGLCRKSPRKPPFWSPMWELAGAKPLASQAA